jgi:hypothetical protein
MAKAKTPKQIDIKIRSLKKQITKLEGQKKRAKITKKPKKTAKKKSVKKKVTRKGTKKRR